MVIHVVEIAFDIERHRATGTDGLNLLERVERKIDVGFSATLPRLQEPPVGKHTIRKPLSHQQRFVPI